MLHSPGSVATIDLEHRALSPHSQCILRIIVVIFINECLQLKNVHVLTETHVTTQTYTAFFVH